MWGSPGKWLRGSSIRAIARHVGHEPDLESFLNTADLPLEENGDDGFDDELFADEITVWKQLKVTKKACDDEESEEN